MIFCSFKKRKIEIDQFLICFQKIPLFEKKRSSWDLLKFSEFHKTWFGIILDPTTKENHRAIKNFTHQNQTKLI